LLFEKACVECVGVVDEILEMLEGKSGREGCAAEGLEELVEGVCPETDDDVVLCGDISQRRVRLERGIFRGDSAWIWPAFEGRLEKGRKKI
jgi:hypothetical protein